MFAFRSSACGADAAGPFTSPFTCFGRLFGVPYRHFLIVNMRRGFLSFRSATVLLDRVYCRFGNDVAGGGAREEIQGGRGRLYREGTSEMGPPPNFLYRIRGKRREHLVGALLMTVFPDIARV